MLYVEALGNEALNRRRIETGHALVGPSSRRARPPRPAAARASRSARIGAAILVGGISELVVAWLDGRIDVTRDQLVDDATELFLGLGDTAFRLATRRIEPPPSAGDGDDRLPRTAADRRSSALAASAPPRR